MWVRSRCPVLTRAPSRRGRALRLGVTLQAGLDGLGAADVLAVQGEGREQAGAGFGSTCEHASPRVCGIRAGALRSPLFILWRIERTVEEQL